jgi:glycerol-3-phosphate cytidylyltransferase
MTRIYNGSTMDTIHLGHLYVLRQMRELAGPAGEVIIGLNTDEFVEQFKGHRPVQPLAERMEIVAAIRYVDRVVVNTGGADSRPVLESVQPDIIAVGHDWYSDDDSRYCRQMGFTREWLDARGIRLHYMRWLPGYSSTSLRSIAGGMA